MNVVVRLIILLMLFLTSQSGIATTTKFTAHQYDVNHDILSTQDYSYDTSLKLWNSQRLRSVEFLVETAWDGTMFASIGDFLATKRTPQTLVERGADLVKRCVG